jgi:integrase
MPKTDHRVALTPTKISGLKPAPEGQRYQVMDALVPGFGIRVTDTGNRTFILRTRYPDQDSPSRRELGKCEDLSLTEARDKARRWRAWVKAGIDPTKEEERVRAAEAQKRRVTFESVVETFIAIKLPGERKGEDVEREIRRDLLPVWKDLSITKITDDHIRTLIKAKVISASAPASKEGGRARTGKTGARNLLALVKRFFRWVAAQGIYGLTAPPGLALSAKDILGDDATNSRDRILSDDEIFAFWRVTGRKSYPVGPAYRLLLLAALRLREGVNASCDEFDPLVLQRLCQRHPGAAIDWTTVPKERLIWTVPKERMKGRKSGKKQARAHAVPLTADILALLESLPVQGGKFMFSTTGGDVPVNIGSKVKKDLDRRMLLTLRAMAKLRGQNPKSVVLRHWVNHDLRRTVRSKLSRLKVSEEAREAVLAHARPGIKGVYDLYDYFDEKREALELWAARLKSIVEPPRDNVIKLYATA